MTFSTEGKRYVAAPGNFDSTLGTVTGSVAPPGDGRFDGDGPLELFVDGADSSRKAPSPDCDTCGTTFEELSIVSNTGLAVPSLISVLEGAVIGLPDAVDIGGGCFCFLLTATVSDEPDDSGLLLLLECRSFGVGVADFPLDSALDAMERASK